MRISDWSSDVCSSDLIELGTYTADGARGAPLRVIVQDLVQAPLQDLAALADGFVAAWNVDGSPRLQRFAADGSAAGTEFAFAGTAGRSGTAAIAAAADGTVLWAVTVADGVDAPDVAAQLFDRSEEHTSELQPLMRISYAVFCLKKKKTTHNNSHS